MFIIQGRNPTAHKPAKRDWSMFKESPDLEKATHYLKQFKKYHAKLHETYPVSTDNPWEFRLVTRVHGQIKEIIVND